MPREIDEQRSGDDRQELTRPHHRLLDAGSVLAGVQGRLAAPLHLQVPMTCSMTLVSLEDVLPEVLEEMRTHPAGWVMVVDSPVPPARYVQVLAPYDGGLFAEAVSNEFLEGDERLGDRENELLPLLGWQWPAPEPVKTFETTGRNYLCRSPLMAGLLIHATVGSFGGVGRRPQNRLGLAA